MAVNLSQFREYVQQQKPMEDPEILAFMMRVGQRTRELTAKLNSHPLSEQEVRELMSEITAEYLDDDFRLFPPFTADFGQNIHLGKNVFINSGARFQDQGGIFIGDDCLIGHNAVITTLNHSIEPERRKTLNPAPVRLGRGVWLGANVTVLPGVTIGDDAVVAAGAVVTKDVPERTIVGGVPAREMRRI